MNPAAVRWTDLSGLDRDILVAIRRLETPKMCDVAEQLQEWSDDAYSYPHVVNHIQQLEDRDLVECQDHPTSPTATMPELTHAGRAVLDSEARFLARSAGLEVVDADGADRREA